ncbi:hypothetical protein IH992_28990 [Candidatus Poribacteria bacterium]|nr:hypothetical protein [Candidatus Poribacteria bacterium]
MDGDIYINGNIDVDGDAVVRSPENYSDDNSNGEWDPGESFTDSNSNGYYDFGTEATGGISGVSGLTGGSGEISPPQLWAMNYQTLADVDVLQEFDDYYYSAGKMVKLINRGIESWANPGSMHNKVWTVPESYPAHIFATHVLTDYGPIDDVVAPDNKNFFLGDWHETSGGWYRNGEKITVNSNDNNKLYFVDGNLWIETNGYGPKIYSQTNGTRLTIVVKGNIYIADKLLYENKSLDGLALLAMNDGETYTDKGNGQYDEGELYEDLNDNGSWNTGEPYNDTPDWQYTPGVDELHDYGLDGVPNTGDTGEGNGIYEGNSENSGNIYLGDPNVGPIGEIDAFLYAQNDFVDYVLNDNNRSPEDFKVFGTMAAGNHVTINRDRQINVTVRPWRRRWKGKTITYSVTQHTKMTVEFDDRLRTGTLELPHLPKGQNRVLEVGGGWGLLSWY